MASQAFKDAINGSGGAFQYGAAIQPMQSQWETVDAYNQRNQGQQEARDLQNWYLRNQQTSFDNQQRMLKNLFSGSGGGSAPGGPSTDNRFAAGLTDSELRLKNLLDNPDSINQSAAYKFRVGQGQEALQRALGAKGMLNSGNRLTELTKYGQDMASQEYDSQYGRLAGLLGTYGQGYIGDKNANTSIYSAQQNAKANDQRNALASASLMWDMNKPQTTGGSRSYGANSGFNQSLYQSAPAAQSAPWSFNTGSYDGIGSYYTNDLTGQQQYRRG